MKKQRGFSLIELLIVVAIIGIIAAIAIPNLLKSKQAANEASAIGATRTIATSEATYQSTSGSGTTFAADMTTLSTVGLVDSALASGTKSGYSYACTGTAPAGTLPSYFDVQSLPLSTGNFGTGNRSFRSNESFVVYQTPGAAITNDGAPPNRTGGSGVPIQ